MRLRALCLLLIAVAGICAGTAHAAGSTSVYQVWFQRGGKLWLAKREQPVTITPVRTAVQAMLAGPTTAESGAGVTTAVPSGSALSSLSVAGGTATVDLSAEYAAPATPAAVWMRLAQLTYTLTQSASVDRVVLRVGGRVVSSLAGVAVPQPMTRSNFRSLLPAITVWNPQIGSTLTGSVRVSGDAQVFAGHVHVQILNQAGVTVAARSVTAGCTLSCRGGYTVLVPFSVPVDQLGTVVVSDDDTDGNGVPQHRVRVPVVLLA
jgi:hypothetical protein